jgi:hypothetical protein
MTILYGHTTAAFTFARVFAGTTIVTRLASALAFAFILATAIVFSTCGTTTMAFTRILTSTTRVTGLASALPFA